MCLNMRKGRFYLALCIYAISAFLSAAAVSNTNEPSICKSLEIITLEGLEKLRNCKVIVGHVRLSNLYVSPTTVLPASIVEEITDYLLVYRVYGLTTLQQIFPKLKLIRGQELFFNKYSLIVLENRELENLGLVSLLRVQKGNVRIESNPVLCFVDTVNWAYILGDNTRQDISFKNKPSNQCPLCLTNHCWNLESIQRNTVYGKADCTLNCGIYGCNEHGGCCSSKCLTGCSNQDCELCANFQHTSGCTAICPLSSSFQLNKRECVNSSNCIRNGLIPYAGKCREACPAHHEKENNDCKNPCAGNYIIRNSKDIEALVDCQYINGSLTIEITEIKAKIVNELENALGQIKEITKYLIVKNSPQLMSLQFLRSLHSIKGEELIDGKYALHVVNNYHLEQIWNQNQNVAILKGRIYFHLNPRLCYDKILRLASSIKSIQKIEIHDVSPNSNGERVICGNNVRTLNATVEDLSSTAVRIRVNPMSANDMNILIGYAHYYKEAPVRNVSWYDGRHGCGHDDWMMDISPNRYIRHVIRNLKPYTQYAYFVKTLTMTEYHIQIDAYSNIQYFRTLTSKPGPVAKVYYHTLSSSEIMIHWWPPFSPNGNIHHYIVNHTVSNIKSNTNATTNYLPDLTAKRPKDICKCEMKEPFYSGPLPTDENYYNKEQIIYDEALPNLIYVSRTIVTPSESKSIKNQDFPKNNSQSGNHTTTNDSGSVESTNKMLNPESRVQKNATSTKKLTKVEEAEAIFIKLRREQDQKALDLQNTNLTDFQIVKPLPICTSNSITNSCRVIEDFKGFNVSSNIHQYLINGLDPEITYNISVRACLDNGECGAETTVFAKTISRAFEEFLNSVHNLSSDIDE